MFLTQERVLAD